MFILSWLSACPYATGPFRTVNGTTSGPAQTAVTFRGERAPSAALLGQVFPQLLELLFGDFAAGVAALRDFQRVRLAAVQVAG